jgi:hypothetical protein
MVLVVDPTKVVSFTVTVTVWAVFADVKLSELTLKVNWFESEFVIEITSDIAVEYFK